MKQMKTPVVVDRRRRKRILTLRNVRNAFLVLLVIVAGMNIRSEMREPKDDDFGRLYERELSKAPVVEAEVVTDRNIAPVDEAASADPFSLESAAREQYLGRPTFEPVPLLEPAPIVRAGDPASRDGAADSRVKIVGGPEGVELVQESRRAPVLGGGFGRE